MCLLLGATSVGKTLLLKRLQKLCLKDNMTDLGEPPSTLPTVGTNLTDITINKTKLTLRELGGCMGPIWPSYYGDCSSLIFVIDAANPSQIASSCMRLLAVLSAEPLEKASILVLFNKIDLPCYMSLVEMKSLFRMDDIISCAKQPISMLAISARDGTGLQEVLKWLHSTHKG